MMSCSSCRVSPDKKVCPDGECPSSCDSFVFLLMRCRVWAACSCECVLSCYLKRATTTTVSAAMGRERMLFMVMVGLVIVVGVWLKEE